jgi:cytochrome d ubiquinol oxidase subunit II
MTLELAAAGVMLIGLVLYALSAGADFGGGVWDLLARGPTADAQRAQIERAIAPIWEANHVWLIFVIVVLFTAFPPAYARLGTELHIPATILLLGIVLRGSAFVFRQYGAVGGRRWGLVFALASIVSSVALGDILGAMTAGPAWWRPFPLAVGAFALVTFAYLAAVYLTVEATGEVREAFRRRAYASGAAVLVLAGACAALAPRGFDDRLLTSWWTIPLLAATGAAALAVVLLLRRGRERLARRAAIVQVTLILLGWALAQHPLLFAPDLTIENAAAPRATLEVMAPILIGGSALLFPSLWYLLRVFKSTR